MSVLRHECPCVVLHFTWLYASSCLVRSPRSKFAPETIAPKATEDEMLPCSLSLSTQLSMHRLSYRKLAARTRCTMVRFQRRLDSEWGWSRNEGVETDGETSVP